MAEFFDIGKKCSQQECHQLDFLPLTCDACEMVFCKNHVNQASHHCTAADHKDRKVADCPLCKGPVPLPSNVQLDGAIQAHIEQAVTDVDLKEQLRNSNDFRNQCSDMMKKHFADYVKGTICIPPLTSDERIGSAGDLRNALAAKIQGGILLNGLPLLQATCDEDVQLPLPLAIRNQIRHLLRLLKLAADDSTQYITLLHPKIGFRIILSQSFVTKIEQVNNQMFRKRMRASFGNQKHQAYPDNQYLLHRILILISRSLCSSQFSALLQNAVQCTSNPNHSSYENITTFCDYVKKEIEMKECATVVRKFYGAKWLPNIGEKTAVLPFLTAEEDRNGTVMQFVDYLLSAKLGGILFTALPSMRYYSDMKARLKLFPEDALLALSFLQQLVHTATLQSQKSEQKRALDSNYFIFFHPTLGVRVLYGRNLQGDIKMQIALQVLLKCLCPSADNMKFKQTPISAESARFLCDELEVEVRNSSNSNFKQQSTCLNLASTFLGLFTFIGYVADVNKRLFLTCDQWLALQSRSMLQIIYGPPNTGKSTLLKILLLEQYNADEERDELERRTQGNGDCLKTMIELSKLFQAQYTRQHQRPVLCIKEEHLEEYKSFLDATKLTEHVEVLLIDKDKLDLTDIVKEAGTRSLFIDSLPHFTFELKETIRARDYKTVVILDCDLSPGLHQPKLYYLEWLRLATQPKRVMENEPPVPSVPASNTAPDTLTENLQSEGDKHQKGDRKNNFPQFFEQALKTFDQFYPEWKEILNSTASETILIPACLDVTHDLYCGPLEEDIPGYDVKVPRFEQYFANQVFKRKPLIVSGIPDFNINNKFCEYDDWFCDEMPLQMNTSTLRIYGNRMNSKGTTVLAVTGWMKPKDLRMVREIATTQLAEYVLFELDTTLRGSLSIIGEWQLDLPDEVPIRVGHSISGEKVERYKYTTVMERNCLWFSN
uniref:AN1-type domain-containing protein n=1 Tax=Plectus sambesii TaxID=2011161 RepID=A0A914W4E1_9BILA